MKKTMVLYPGLVVSHFVPMVQLADVLLEEGYAVVVAFIDPTLKGDIALAAVIDRVAASKPSVVFHMLPRVEDAPTFVHAMTRSSWSGTRNSWAATASTSTTSSSPCLLAASTP
jgi:hypothetical protein